MARKPQPTTTAAPVPFAADARKPVDFADLVRLGPKHHPDADQLSPVVAMCDAPASCTPDTPGQIALEIGHMFSIYATLYGYNADFEARMAQHLAENDAAKRTPAPVMDGDARLYTRRMEQMGRSMNGLVAVLLRDAVSACQYWRDQQAELHEMVRSIGDAERDDRAGVAGFATAIERKQSFVAALALRGVQTAAMAHEARRQLRRFTGSDFEPYRAAAPAVAPTKEAAAARAAALDI